MIALCFTSLSKAFLFFFSSSSESDELEELAAADYFG
jgi:hypothetical protein